MRIRRIRMLMMPLAAAGLASSAFGQTLTYTQRSGQNFARCGINQVGPAVLHTFNGFDATHDSIAVSDPGGPTWPSSNASADLDSVPSASGLSVSMAGSAARGGPQGSGTTANGRGFDSWNFTLSAPTCFTLSATLNATSSDATFMIQNYNLTGLDGLSQIIPESGTPVAGIGASITTPTSLTRTTVGTLRAGRYNLSLRGEVMGSSFPYSGSYSNSVTLTIGCTSPGDMNGDGVVDTLDIEPLVLALTDLAAFEQQFPGIDPLGGDINNDMMLDGRDIELFAHCLLHGSCS